MLAWFWQAPLRWLTLALLILMGALALALLPVLMLEKEFDRLEQAAIQRDIARVVEGVQSEIRTMEAICADWGNWDDAYAFIADRNPVFQKSSLGWDSILSSTHVQLIYFLDRNGRIVWGDFHPEDAAHTVSLPAFAQEHIGELPLLSGSREETRSGLFLTPNGPLLLVSQPIRPSNGKGPSAGTLLMGRLLDRGRLNDLSHLLAIPFEARDTLRNPLDPKETSAWTARGWKPQIRIQSESHLSILIPVPDIYGKDRIIFTLPWERTIHFRGQESGHFLFTVLFLAVSSVAALLLLAFRQHLRLVKHHQESLEEAVAWRHFELKEARARQEIEDRHHVIISLASSAILMGNASGRIFECNAAATRIFHYSMEEITRLRLLDLFTGKHAGMIDRILAENLPTEDHGLEIEGRRKNGAPFPADIIAKFFTAGGERRFVAYIHDITDRKHAEEALSYARKQESLGALAGGIAHDFNNLFCAVLGNLDLAQNHVSEDTTLSTHLERIRNEVTRASELSQKMLAFSGKGRFVLGPVDLNRLLEELKPQLALELSKGATLNFRCAEGLPGVEGDPLQIQQVLLSLLINASESLGENEGTIDVTTAIQDLDQETIRRSFPGQPLRPGPHVTVEVADTGCGIEPENLRRIFDPFYSTKFAGRGLSLPVVQGILRGHKAGYAITSAVQAGTRFKLFFPIVLSAQPAPVLDSLDKPIPRGVVLFVDDESTLREAAAEILDRAGYDVITAEDGLDAVDQYTQRGREIALVILDVTMPRMDGKAALKAILALDPEAKIVLSSGYTEHEVIQQIGGESLAGFLPKPYRMAQLQSIVGRFVKPKGVTSPQGTPSHG